MKRSSAVGLSPVLAIGLGFATTVSAQKPANFPADRNPAEAAAEIKTGPFPGLAGEAKPGGLRKATFGGGCFWCTEAVFERIPGVVSVVSGYAGGTVPNPTYELVSTGVTGHAEVIQVVFDPSVVSYEILLEVFWRTHDARTPNAQGPDVGPQYRSIILYQDDDQKRAAQTVCRDLKARKVLRGPVTTELVPLTAFYPAEPYHQDYYTNHPLDPYSMVYIEPKFDHLRKMMKKRPVQGRSPKTAKRAPKPDR